jgi:pantoate--beta-alanine ligase
MGALHAGHLAMVRQAVESRLPVVVSIFVNPTQFGPDEDYHRYPRTPEKDLAALDDIGGVDAVFAPGVGDMYPDGTDALVTEVTVTDLSDHLCGAFRPGHFKGVATVVTKLFNICVPTVAFFGKKDAQQYVILKRMARDRDCGCRDGPRE